MLILACANCGSLKLISTGFSGEFHCTDCDAILQLWNTRLVDSEKIFGLEKNPLFLATKIEENLPV